MGKINESRFRCALAHPTNIGVALVHAELNVFLTEEERASAGAGATLGEEKRVMVLLKRDWEGRQSFGPLPRRTESLGSGQGRQRWEWVGGRSGGERS